MGVRRLWQSVSEFEKVKYTCGYCGSLVAPDKGFFAKILNEQGQSYQSIDRALVCPNCSKITYIDFEGDQTPKPLYGANIEKLPPDVNSIYEEARKCFSTGSYSSIAFCCRKILMHIAVEKGDSPGKSFSQYVEYLDSNNYIPRDCKSWVDKIRTVGNDVNHQIILTSEQDARMIMEFTTLLLKIVYEFNAKKP